MLLSLGWIQALTLLIAAKLESGRWSWFVNIAHGLEVIWIGSWSCGMSIMAHSIGVREFPACLVHNMSWALNHRHSISHSHFTLDVIRQNLFIWTIDFVLHGKVFPGHRMWSPYLKLMIMRTDAIKRLYVANTSEILRLLHKLIVALIEVHQILFWYSLVSLVQLLSLLHLWLLSCIVWGGVSAAERCKAIIIETLQIRTPLHYRSIVGVVKLRNTTCTESSVIWFLAKHDLRCLVLALVESDLHLIWEVSLIIRPQADLIDHRFFNACNNLISCRFVPCSLLFATKAQRSLMNGGIFMVCFEDLVSPWYCSFWMLNGLLETLLLFTRGSIVSTPWNGLGFVEIIITSS